MEISLPTLPNDENDPTGKLKEKVSDVHVALTKNYVAIMRRNGTILKIDRSQFTTTGNKMSDPIELKWSTINVPVDAFYEDKREVNEIGLKWMFVADLVQFKLKPCLLQYDLNTDKEVACLNNYMGAFDDSAKYVLTPFFIPVTSVDPKT